jgi:DNA polymerase-3 subunit delta
MKIAANAADRFAAAPPDGVRAVLVYGPDSGLVRERAGKLVAAVVDDPSDPFRVVELTGAQIREDAAILSDEAQAMSLVGGRRAVRVREAGDAAAGACESLLQGPPGDSLVVIEAGGLGPRSRLRVLFEQAADAAALPCYADEGGALVGLVNEVLGAHGLRPTRDAVAFLCANLGSDRMVSRSELEKLALYAAGQGEVTMEDAAACVGDSTAMTLDDLAFAVGGGDMLRAARLADRAFQEGAASVQVLRAIARHIQRLHLVAGQAAAGKPMEAAMKTLRPPVFFKAADAFAAQARLWTPEALDRAIAALNEAELDCKSTGAPDRALTNAVLTRLAGFAAQRRQRRRAG